MVYFGFWHGIYWLLTWYLLAADTVSAIVKHTPDPTMAPPHTTHQIPWCHPPPLVYSCWGQGSLTTGGPFLAPPRKIRLLNTAPIRGQGIDLYDTNIFWWIIYLAGTFYIKLIRFHFLAFSSIKICKNSAHYSCIVINSVILCPLSVINSVILCPLSVINSVIFCPVSVINSVILCPLSVINSVILCPLSVINSVILCPLSVINLVIHSPVCAKYYSCITINSVILCPVSA